MNEALIKKLIAERGEEANGPVRLSFSDAELKIDADDNSITVVASTMGTADDRSGDVIFPGAYAKAIPGFLRNGFVAIGHEWDDLPIAMPMTAEEKGRQMVSRAVFHSTPDAQNARTVCKERLDAGKSVSVSVGFQPDYSDEDGVKWFENGSDLLAWATGKGFDLSGFDQSAVKKLRFCRAITKIKEWFEWSIVGVGMNRGAKAIAAKSLAERKSLQNTVGALLQAKIHLAFTVAADELAIRGYMDTAERIALSGNISSGLKAFAAEIDPEVGERTITPEDVDCIAAKTISDEEKPPAGRPLAEHLDSVLAAVEELTPRLADYKAMRESDDRPMSPERVAQVNRLMDSLKALLPEEAPTPAETGGPEREARLKAMLTRAGSLTGASK